MSVIERMAAYVRRYGLAPIGPHRPLADRLLQGAAEPCEACAGKSRDVKCVACSGSGYVVRWSQAQIDAARAQVLKEFPHAATPQIQPPDEAPLEEDASLGLSDPQDVIDALVHFSTQARSVEVFDIVVFAIEEIEALHCDLPILQAIADLAVYLE